MRGLDQAKFEAQERGFMSAIDTNPPVQALEARVDRVARDSHLPRNGLRDQTFELKLEKSRFQGRKLDVSRSGPRWILDPALMETHCEFPGHGSSPSRGEKRSDIFSGPER